MDERYRRTSAAGSLWHFALSSTSAMRRTFVRLTAAGAVASGVVLAALALGGSTANGAVSSDTHYVPGYLYGLPLATRVGPAAASQRLTVGVEVQGAHQAAEQALYNAMYTPGSRQYHHFLTPAQFNNRFGVTPATSAAVRRWLTAGGLSMSGSDGYYMVSGTVAQFDKVMKVTINDYVFKGQHFFANDKPASVPNALPIVAIVGLDNVNKVTLDALHGHTLKRLAALQRADRSRGAIRAAKDVGPQAGYQEEFTPQELWGIYDDPGAKALTKSNGTSNLKTIEKSKVALGQGQTMGIFGEGETSSVVAQLRLFEAAMGFPKVPVRVVHTEGGPDSDYGDNTGAIEWYLDSQSSTGMSPDVSQLDFYFAKTLYDKDILQDFHSWANAKNGPREMNASFGECEENPTNTFTGPLAQQPYGTELGDELEAAGDPLLKQANMEGRTLFSSAGDNGSGCPELVAPVIGAGNGVTPQPAPFVGYPCDSTYVVCVGGTVVSSKGDTYPTEAQRDEETSWTDSGGGSSHFIPEPKYQDGIKHIDIPCQTNPQGKPYPADATPTCRGVPDVADISGNITGDGYFIYIDGEPSSEGGTSLSSPTMMGQWTRIQSAASKKVQKAGGLGYANPIIYRQAKDADTCGTTGCPGAKTYDRDFFDITQSELGAGNGAYRPGPGWDYASGWGSLNVANFMQDVSGKTTASYAAAAPEKPAKKVTTATMTSPVGNATNPADVSLGNVQSLDLTKATLTTSANGTDIIGTLSGPEIGSTPASNSPDGNTFYFAWEYGGKVYYAQANQSTSGSFTYSSGNTGTYGTSTTYGYTDNSGTSATGSFDAATHTITITVPAKEVGSPTVGSALTVPQAFDQLDASPELSLTTDSSDDLVPISVDAGKADSIGEEVIVGGVAKGSSHGSGSFGGCTKGGGPVVHAHAKFKPNGIFAHGVSSNRGCKGHITSVGVSVARSAAKNISKCQFLLPSGRFGKVTSCRPRDFQRAKGTTHWTFTRHMTLPQGVYFVWAHATNSKHSTTKNRADKHIFFRLR